MRDDWVKAVAGTIANYREAAANPGEKYSHIAPEKLAKITSSCNELEKWLEKKNQELAQAADDILKEPKPAPPKEEKKEEPPKDAPQEEKKDETPAQDANDVD